MTSDLIRIYDRVLTDAVRSGYAGADPFDGLNSRLFSATPIKRIRLARLAWLQLVKRSPFDLRSLLFVSPGVNPKGLALFALAETARFRIHPSDERRTSVADILKRLTQVGIRDGDTLAFGYNFDWQSRNFFAPLGTAAIVPTAFAQQAYLESYEAFGNESHLTAADAICRFITTKLNRSIETDDELCFSYTPIDQTQIYNASLLAGECLARIGALTDNAEYTTLAAKTARLVIRRQRDDGAWGYGQRNIQAWVDNFHTAYILLSLRRISSLVPEIVDDAEAAFERGMSYWLGNFFLADGTPKYYDKSTYPIDIHSAAVAISTFSELAISDRSLLDNARRVAMWTIENMYDGDGSFYYQLRKSSVVRTPFIRWGQAWMAYALAKLIEADE